VFASRENQARLDLTCATDEDDGQTCAILEMGEQFAFGTFAGDFGVSTMCCTKNA